MNVLRRRRTWWQRTLVCQLMIHFSCTLLFLIQQSRCLSAPIPPTPFEKCNNAQILRSEFLSATMGSVAIGSLPSWQLLSPASAAESSKVDRLEFPLRFLPKSGCWGLSTTISRLVEEDDDEEEEEESFDYLAIIDTGSPFLTAPGQARGVSRSSTAEISKDMSMEQYGASRGDMEWRQADLITWIVTNGIFEASNVTLGVASPLLIQETGGIFCGLIRQDDLRPTWWEQIGKQYTSFRLNLSLINSSMVLSSRSLLPRKDPNLLRLWDLSKSGPDLYHYAVLSSSVIIEWRQGGSMILPQIERPIVIVLDTGLTGCIVHDTLAAELGMNLTSDAVKGFRIALPTESGSTLCLESNPKYWRLDCFHLPWFYEDHVGYPSSQKAPHIIAVGATFWSNVKSLSIDTTSRMALIEPKVT